MNELEKKTGGGKSAWISPKTEIQTFKPNAYCNVCFSLACDLGAAGGTTGKKDANGLLHTAKTNGSGCGHAKNQRFRIDDAGNVSITEENIPGYSGSAPCTVTSGTTLNINNCIGQKVTWTTTVSSNVYLHEGTIQAEEQGRNANHS